MREHDAKNIYNVCPFVSFYFHKCEDGEFISVAHSALYWCVSAPTLPTKLGVSRKNLNEINFIEYLQNNVELH